MGLARNYQVYWKLRNAITTSEVCGRGGPASVKIIYEKSNVAVLLNGVLIPARSSPD
jgi:hypothetical protein